MTDGVIEGYREAMAGAVSRVEEHPEERASWAAAVFIGHAAGLLSAYSGPTPELHRVRDPARNNLIAFMTENPDTTALEKVRKGLALLKEEYEGVLPDLADLKWDHMMVCDLERLATESPVVNEVVAIETLRYAGLES